MNNTISLFEATKEKGSREWKTANPIRSDRSPGSYRVSLPRIVHLPVQHAAPHYQQFFILKNAH